MNNKNKQSEMWKTADRRVLHVSEMESTHLLNAMAMLRRKAAALYSQDPDYYSLIGAKATDLLPPIYKAMVLEMQRRNKPKPRPPGRILEL